MNNLRHSAAEVDVLVRLEVLQVFPAETPSHDQTEHGPPSLATAVQEVIRWFVQTLVLTKGAID